MTERRYIDSSAKMIAAIREIGIIPLFKSPVSGWSIEELTEPDWWFSTSDILGPWDWKIDAIHEGFLYGKYISRKSAFATERMYRHLMNWRRSLAMYKVAEGGTSQCATIDQRLQKHLSPFVLSAIRENESLESAELRAILNESVPTQLREQVGGHMEKYLLPKITKEAVSFILCYLDMGTWTVIGDITRVYRGPNCEYKGWQRNTITTPEALLEAFSGPYPIDDYDRVNCSPEESRQIILDHLNGLYPGNREKFEKLI